MTIIHWTIPDTTGNARKIELSIEAPTGDDDTTYTQHVLHLTTSPFCRKLLRTRNIDNEQRHSGLLEGLG
jgi:hypothetical protein